jgi:SAM-dependent methyltransferase
MATEFDRFADDYDGLLRDPIRDAFAGQSRFFHERKWILLRGLLSKAGLVARDASWLDVGCGRAELLRLGAGSFARVAGCDPSVKMSRQPGIEVVEQSSPADLPFAAESFDLITAVCVFHHVEERDRPALTATIRRVLKPGGLFCLIEHNPLNPVTRMIVNRSPIDRGARLLTASQARKQLKNAGLQTLLTDYFLYLPERWFRRAAPVEAALRKVPLGGQYAVLARKGTTRRDSDCRLELGDRAAARQGNVRV